MLTATEKDKRKVAEDYTPTLVKSVFPKKRHLTLNLNGWGFLDSVFEFQNGQLMFTGNRFVNSVR